MSASRSHVIVCTECGAMSATPSVRGWRGYLIDAEPDSTVLAFHCPSCQTTEADRPALPAVSSRGRRWRDAHKPNPAVFRVALDTAGAGTAVPEEEIDSACEVVVAGGGWDVSVLAAEDAGYRRLQFDLEAQNQGHAMRLAFEVLKALNNATPSVAAGWVLTAVSPA